MSDATDRVRAAVARWDGVAPDALDVREHPGARGTLVLVARDDRWFAARAIYVDADTHELFGLPSNAAFMPRAEEFLADPDRRARTRIAEAS